MASALLRASIDGAVAASLIWLLCRCAPRLGPSTRTWLWWLVAAKFAIGLVVQASIPLPVLPPQPLPFIPGPRGGVLVMRRPVVLPNPIATGVPNATRLLGGYATPAEIQSLRQGLRDRVWPETLVPPTVDRIVRLLAGRLLDRWQASTLRPWLGPLWMLGFLVATGLGIRRWLAVRASLAATRPASPGLRQLVSALAGRLGLRRIPEVRVSDTASTPLLMGVARPVVILPARALAVSPARQRLAIAHELAHLKRQDLLLGWVPALVEATFFFHPFAKLAAREYAISRETATDALVLSRFNAEPAAYAQMLVDLGLTPRWRGLSVAGASWSAAMLKRRLVSLKEPPRPGKRARALTVALIGVAVLGLVPFQLTARSWVSRPQTWAPASHLQMPDAAWRPARTVPPAVVRWRESSGPAAVTTPPRAETSTTPQAPTQAPPSTDWWVLPGEATAHRVLVLFLDDRTLTGDVRTNTVASIEHFVDTQMTAGDLVAILAASSELQALRDFTNDKARLRETLEAFKGQSPPVGPLPNDSVLRGLQTVCGRLRGIQQHKGVIVFGGTDSKGFDPTELQATSQTCANGNVALYFVDGNGLHGAVHDTAAPTYTDSVSIQTVPGLSNSRSDQLAPSAHMRILVFDAYALTGALHQRAVGFATPMVDMMPDADSMAIMSVDDKIEVLTDFTPDRGQLRAAVSAFESRSISTPAMVASDDRFPFALTTICNALRSINQRKDLYIVGTGSYSTVAACQVADVGVSSITFTTNGITSRQAETPGAIVFSLRVEDPKGSVTSALAAPQEYVLIDLEVTDAGGNHVGGLGPDDFRVFEDGGLQKILFFEESTGPHRFSPPVPEPPAPGHYTIGYSANVHDAAVPYRPIRVETSRLGVRLTFRQAYYGSAHPTSDGVYAEETPGLVMPVVQRRVEAHYTADALRAKIAGDVVITAVVGVDGRVTEAAVARSLDATLGLDDEAVSAARQWIFIPGRLRGEPVPVRVRVVIPFRIH